MCDSMETAGSTNIPFENFHREKPKIIGLFSEFGCIAYVTNTGKIKRQMRYKNYKELMVGCADNHTRDTCKFKRQRPRGSSFLGTLNGQNGKKTDLVEIMKMLRDLNEEDLVPGK